MESVAKQLEFANTIFKMIIVILIDNLGHGISKNYDSFIELPNIDNMLFSDDVHGTETHIIFKNNAKIANNIGFLFLI